ncbi:MAG TPA: orotidine-5'-phosphate decarboxylase [Nocardioidaceae bacterium]|nr:orotidine-5'-phosphate decarboxylase [Nocardioidaceae bacterium]
MTAFGARLRAATDARGPLCVGVDPHPALLAQWGLTDDPAGLERFAMTVVETLADTVAVLKPQSAFFERHGSAGIAVLERVVAAARWAGALVVLDVKRGDIGSTIQAYADAYLGPSAPLSCDAVTASPYLGFGSLDPMIDTALAHDAGVFVLALTSNVEGPEVQHARVARGTAGAAGTVAGRVLEQVAARNAGRQPQGSVGAVVGATIGTTGECLAVNGPLLVPGVGAQGGTAADVRRIFADCRANVLPSTSRAVLSAGPTPGALRAAARRTGEEFATLLR